jgi:hypothetical protein
MAEAPARGGFGRGFGDRGRGDRGRGDRGRGGRGRGRKDEEEKWVPCTKLGRLVQQVRSLAVWQQHTGRWAQEAPAAAESVSRPMHHG